MAIPAQFHDYVKSSWTKKPSLYGRFDFWYDGKGELKLLDVLQKKIHRYVGGDTFYFSSVKETLEDYTTAEYLRDVAMQAGMNTAQIYIEDIGYDNDNRCFVDLNEKQMRFLFKFYPWEYMLTEEFVLHLPTTDITFFEPPWNMILSNKAILALLWEMYPNHPNLLPSFVGFFSLHTLRIITVCALYKVAMSIMVTSSQIRKGNHAVVEKLKNLITPGN